MFIEILLLLAGIILALIAIGESINQPVLGLVGSILLLIAGFWLLNTNIEIVSGQAITTSQTLTTDVFNTTIISYNQTASLQRINLPPTPYVKFEWLLGITSILLAIYGIFRYSAFNLPDKQSGRINVR